MTRGIASFEGAHKRYMGRFRGRKGKREIV